MSLLSQLRPTEGEKQDRNWGKRRYVPEYNLCRHIDLPATETLYDPLRPPRQVQTAGQDATGHHNYRTPHGLLEQPCFDQFVRHFQWKTTSENAYVNFCPKSRPPRLPAFQVRPDMVKHARLVEYDEGGPEQPHQLLDLDKRMLPEAKVWPSVAAEYRPFPFNTFGRRDHYRYVNPDYGNRPAEETAQVRAQIKDLIKRNALNPQFVKPVLHVDTLDQVRAYEGLERPPGRNPPCMTTHYMAHYNRYLPTKEYQRPTFGSDKPLSVTLPPNYFNKRASEPPNSLDYLPMPWNYTKKPTDHRLISGYRL